MKAFRATGWYRLMLLGVLLLAVSESFAWGADLPKNDLTQLNIEDLMNIEVTSAAKKAQRMSDVTAAVFVITREDIRRSGATSIAEVLRVVPGLDVARIDANKWAVTARGFNGIHANKLLVMIDGRSVYTPLFSGVYWDVQDTMLEDVDRIEVIRGPGATLWGANAVTGVINIITKRAEETQGGVVSAGGGTEERGFGNFRYGGMLGEATAMRVYAKYFNRDGGTDTTGRDTADDWDVVRGGFRMDSKVTERDTATFQGDIYDGGVGQVLKKGKGTMDDTGKVAGMNFLFHWDHAFTDGSNTQLQLYYDHTKRTDALLGERRDTADLEFQHQFKVGGLQEIVWGAGYRFTVDDVDNGLMVSLNPARRGDHLVSLFVQDDLTLVEERLRLTLGSKLEHNDYTGFEVQPNARLLWTPSEGHAFWGAVSRAVRTPSRAEHDITILTPGPPGAPQSISGNHDFKAERLLAYELGYRVLPASFLSLDLATFYNRFDGLMTLDKASPTRLHYVNGIDGESYGAEIAATWSAITGWQVKAGVTYLSVDLDSTSSVKPDRVELAAGDTPEYQASLRSLLDLPYNLELDSALYYVDKIRNEPYAKVPAYFRLDLRLGWRPTKVIEVSVGAQNLLDGRHPEFPSREGIVSTEVERSYYGKVTWRF